MLSLFPWIPTRNTPPGQSPKHPKEPDERKLREERILDAAATLLVRWGYRKTTMDDVAREADVGKGTIYLHWKTKDDLFRAALWRAHQQASEDFEQRIAADPEGRLPHRLWVHSVHVVLDSPLLTALIKGQPDLFQGQFGTGDRKRFAQLLAISDASLIQSQQAGLIRADLSLPVMTYVMIALKVGIITAPDLLGEAHLPSLENLTEALSDLICRWLSPE